MVDDILNTRSHAYSAATDRPRAWILGASSGVGAATCHRLAQSGFDLVISSRRRSRLEDLAVELRPSGSTVDVIDFDAADREATLAAAKAATESGKRLDAFVYSSGMNVQNRFWNDLVDDESRDMYSVNVLAAMTALGPVIEHMRDAGGGSIVLVSSISSWKNVPHAGVAYASSKAALSALAQSINTEEAAAGLRACNLCPGEIDSEFLRHRPEQPTDERRRTMLSPDDVAKAVHFVVTSPAHVTLNELVISPCR